MKTTPCLTQLYCLIGLLLPATAAPGAAVVARPNLIVFYTDDHGHADLGCQGVVQDIKTPNVDALATGGVRMVHGYSTAPQCVPSRGGLMTGKFQCRFGLEDNGSALDGFNRETTIAERLRTAGYATAQFGKWHLGPATEIPQHGFKHVFSQHANGPFAANITVDGKDRPMGVLANQLYHIDGCSRAAAAIIERYHDQPFFLYVAYRAPHVPLDAPKRYLSRFPGKMPERRRQALAMLSAVDDGVGLITDTLRKFDLTEQTLIFYLGDNGAPLKIHKADEPGGGPGWDGSLNDPLNGEKGMLAEGGMHVPFVMSWPGTLPGGRSYPHPVTALDVAATAAALAGVPLKPGDLDGVNLVPHLKGEFQTPPHEALCWRWGAQAAIRQGKWKLLRGGEREYLYDLDADLGEKQNLALQYPDRASQLRARLQAWCAGLRPPGLAAQPMAPVWNDYFDFYLEGKPARPLAPTRPKAAARPQIPGPPAPGLQGWQCRNGTLSEKDGVLRISPEGGGKAPFITRAKLELTGPVVAKVTLRPAVAGTASFAWRTAGQQEFLPENRVTFAVTAADDWRTHEVRLPAAGTIVHVRLHLPGGTTLVRSLRFDPAAGGSGPGGSR